MQVYEPLKIEGTSTFAVLCYGIFPIEVVGAAFDTLCSSKASTTSKTYKLEIAAWPNSLILNETFVAQQDRIHCVIADALASMSSLEGCIASVCMCDGAFGSYRDLFALNVAAQVYAFSIGRYGPVISLDDSILSSPGWTEIIVSAANRIK